MLQDFQIFLILNQFGSLYNWIV